ncbi:sigma-70 family RNA polymerase sigma factor [Aeoliella mucimassa]|uniref:RNA polymerase sigma factor n=1 Tax=Aeoliella mucimassa TaxID=2527972 RepID=A0A518AQN5_9BACT|nr:RNA polymerase sigma factor [Aeoliella mucimassa]
MHRLTSLANESPRPAPDRPAGQIAAFNRLLAGCESDLMTLVYALLPHWPDAEDVVQRTRVVLWQKFDSFEPGSNFRSWAMQVARFEVKNFRRRQQSDRLMFSDDLVDTLAEVNSTLTEDLEWRRERLQECIKQLRESDRRILQHCYGPTATTIRNAAELLSRPVNTLYKALNRIRRTLQECVSSNGLAG